MSTSEETITLNRWRLILGQFAEQQISLSAEYQEMDSVLNFLYAREYTKEQGIRQEAGGIFGGRGGSHLSIPAWIGKVRKLFPQETVEILQKQAIEKYQLKELLMDETILRQMQPDMELLKNILSFRDIMPSAVLSAAREVAAAVIKELEEQLRNEIKTAFYGKKNPYKSSAFKSIRNFDFKKTIRRNLKNYQTESRRLVPERLYFCQKVKKQNTYHIIVLVDESGSMVESVIYAAVMAGIFAGIPAFKTDLILFDTNIVDVTDYVKDPVETIMSVQLGGGTDISKALGYAASKITQPSKTIVVLISDLYDGYDYRMMYRRVFDIIETGAAMFVLPALNYHEKASYDRNAAQKMASLGARTAAITPKELAKWIAKIVL